MKILADEGFNGNFVRELREVGFDIEWIVETNAGILDEEVIEIAKANNQILLTEDKDFGEWVFAHQATGLTIVFVRYKAEDILEIIESLVLILKELEGSKSYENIYEFITISRGKIRRREI